MVNTSTKMGNPIERPAASGIPQQDVAKVAQSPSLEDHGNQSSRELLASEADTDLLGMSFYSQFLTAD